jgi:hypothetical protein
VDSLTAQYLARALDARWRGRRVQAVAFDRDARAVAVAVDVSPPVRFPFAPGSVAATELPAPPADGAHLAGWTVASVAAPEDDRRLTITLERVGKFRGSKERHATLDVSFVPAARGARLKAEGRESRIGARLPPAASARPALDDAAVAAAIQRGDRAALLAGRWMSAAVIEWLQQEPALAPERYRALCELPATPPPCVGPLFSSVPGGNNEPAAPPVDDKKARAIARMERELAAAAFAPRVREAAQRMLALGDVPAPASIALGRITVETGARPAERAPHAAARMHAEARSMERALESLPARIAALRAAPAPARPPAGKPSAPPKRGAARAPRPFREYKSSGGLDIWVGRGAASNDSLTFHEAAPEDVWLHARDAAGAHVVLRWTKPEPPPAKDLAEAAALAAWHSKSRGNTVAPVDWTRRKHVRKPRGGPAGLVLVDHVKTVNARPSAELERKLRRTD